MSRGRQGKDVKQKTSRMPAGDRYGWISYQCETTPASHRVPGNIVKKVKLLASIEVSAHGSHRHEVSALGDSITPWDRNNPRG